MAVSNLTARVVFAVVAIPVVLAIIWAGGFVLASLLAVAGALATAEYYQVARAGSYEPMEVVGVPLAFVLPIGVFGYHVGRFTPPVLTLGAVIIAAVFALAIFARGPGGHPIGAAAVTAGPAPAAGGRTLLPATGGRITCSGDHGRVSGKA